SNLPGLDSSPEHEILAKKMHGAFLQFIKNGRPEAEGLPAWPAYNPETKRMMVFNEICRVEETPEPETPDTMPFQVFKLTGSGTAIA
ncbi:MAG: carboxylesterase family protein, partial [Acidaminococcaceae bacterium]|nr:carboxylesterase family protein [Acidaminococcaceae bacterium]